MRRFEWGPEDHPGMAQAEALQAIAHELERIADAMEDAED